MFLKTQFWKEKKEHPSKFWYKLAVWLQRRILRHTHPMARSSKILSQISLYRVVEKLSL